MTNFNYQVGFAAPSPLPIKTEEEVMSSWLTKGEPIVSICCATYNHVAYLEDALRGFLGQVTSFPFEVILRDDASTDGTTAIVKEYAQRYPNIIRPIIEDQNKYALGAKATLVMLPFARGEYIALCEGDDYWVCPTKLEMQVELIRANTQCTMCVAIAVRCEYKNNTLIISSIASGKNKLLQYFDDFTSTHFHVSTYLMRSNILRAVAKKYVPNIPFSDTALCYMLIHYGPFAYLHEVVSVYRLTEKGIWSGANMYNKFAWIINRDEAFYKYFEPEYKEFFGHQLLFYYRKIIWLDIRQCNLRQLSANFPRYIYFRIRYLLLIHWAKILRRCMRVYDKN